jgi:hypothetical protein
MTWHIWQQQISHCVPSRGCVDQLQHPGDWWYDEKVQDKVVSYQCKLQSLIITRSDEIWMGAS